MEASVYEAEFENESTHWWFVQRRNLFARLLDPDLKPGNARFLDVGTSTGTNLRLLTGLGFSNVVGVELNPDAAEFARQKTGVEVVVADSTALPFENNEFDCVFATDVIEHIENDEAALKELARVLRPGGKLIITVPAFMSLWGLQDDLSHHHRRYRMHQLRRVVVGAGLTINESFYFNFLLFPAVFLVRRLMRVFPLKIRSEGDLNAGGLNFVLSAVFNLDCRLARRLRVPFGVSACVVCSRPES
jgi:SAM-dependent methyltransferase